MILAWASADDAEALARIHARAFERPWTAQAIAGLLSSPGVFGLLGRHKQTDLGMALCRTAAGEMEVLTIGVVPGVRRSGVAKALMTAAMGAAREGGAETAFLEVAEDNAGAIALYRDLGFQPAGLRPAYYARGPGGTADAVVMRLDLRPLSA